MKKFIRWTLALLLIVALAIGVHLYSLSTKSAKEKYPADTFYTSAPNKRALIIVAHDDDIVSSTGSLKQWTRAGWKIRQLCFYQQAGIYREKDARRNPLRKKALADVAAIQGLEGVDPIDMNFRKDTLQQRPYMAMPYDSLEHNYLIDSMRSVIASYIELYRPTVIFSLDDSLGGYGHPDHTLVSRLVVEYCREHKNDSGFSVKRIYQSVFAPSQSEGIMKDMEVYQHAKKLHGINGMPLPDVEFDISEFGNEKKRALQAYTTEQNSLKQIWPSYRYYPGWLYFRIFDREFYRVIEVSDL
jgi:LmbE family N-acetylglucosaminyl deacetylase